MQCGICGQHVLVVPDCCPSHAMDDYRYADAAGNSGCYVVQCGVQMGKGKVATLGDESRGILQDTITVC